LGFGFALAYAGAVQAAPRSLKDVKYASAGATPLLCDVYLPEGGAHPAGMIIWVHGGAWRAGSRSSVELLGMTARGWALASVDYRLSTTAKFPAQIFDIKAAIRFLRAHAAEYGYPPDRFVIAGSSAGAHLAALVGVSNGERDLEGTLGDNPGVSSDVQAIVSLYGASNLTSILSQSTPHGLEVRVPALELLLGGAPDRVPELARLASPVFHVDAGDPPLLLFHGDQDQQMPINQSHELEGVYEKLKLPVRFVVVHGSGHGGPAFTAPQNLDLIDAFLRQQFASLAARKP
ncbi:MAG TPA: alpha/beta hydrolase, partial [Polyangiaceae bacterium]|nr:alpha/beta hydrolase [Polyangiaceae bacterium]